MKNLITRVFVLAAFLLVSSASFAQIETERDLAEAIFETIQNNDVETFSSYCPTAEQMTQLVAGLGESTPKEQSIKQELQSEDAADIRSECISEFNRLLEELTTNSNVINDGEFPEMIVEDIRFEITNLKTSEVKFLVSFNNVEYEIEVNVFNTNTDIYMYALYYSKTIK